MCWILLFGILFSVWGRAQTKDYLLTSSGDTINRVDQQGRKQGPWVHHQESLRGEPGYEEEGMYLDGRKEGQWRIYNLMGDLTGVEQYRWGLKNGRCRYFNNAGELRLEESWKALNPDKIYDTVDVEDPDHPDQYRQVVIKNEGASIRHGDWNYYNPQTGLIIRTESYELGKLTTPLNMRTPGNKVKQAPDPR
ncbi:MAG: toxin-antitoxin system YwqK family antitoxin [Chitinophagaceae bacterium]